MKKVVLKTYGKIIALLMGLAGFITGCNLIPGGGIAEYGAPSADFVVKGKVTDKFTRKPINNMAVINKSRTSPYGNDTVKTNADGTYELKFTATAFGAENLTIYASDIDGEQNGAYASDTLRIKASDLKQIAPKRGSWYFGTFEKTEANFQLKPATEAMYGVMAAEYRKIEK